MQPLMAHVRNGRLVLDEPTNLPDGDVVELVRFDEALANGGDDMDVVAGSSTRDREAKPSAVS